MLRVLFVIVLVVLVCPLEAQMTGFAAAEAFSRENRARSDSIAESVDTGTGAFIFETSVMSVLGGRDVIIDLTFNSLLTSASGPLGPGWSHPFLARMEGDPNGVVTVYWDPNKKNSFRFTGQGLPYEGLELAVAHDRLQRQTDGSWRLRLYDGTIYEFDSNGTLERIGNKLSQFLDVDYESQGRVAVIHEPISNRRIFLYYRKDGTGRLQHLQDAEDRVVFFDYDGQARLSEIHDPVTISQVYGSNFQGISIPDNNPAGVVHTIDVDREDPIGLVAFASATLNHSNPADLRLRLTSPAGTTATLTTNTSGPTWDLSQVMLDFFQGQNPQGTWRVEVADLAAGGTGFLNTFRLQFTSPTESYQITYNNAGQIATVSAPDGGLLLANTYDAQGRVIAQEDGRGGNEPAMYSYTPTPTGVVTTFTDRTGATTTFEHDSSYNLVRLTDALLATTQFEYDSSGNLTQETDPLGRITRFSYTPNGNLERYTDPLGRVTFYEYDSENNATGVTDALGKRTAFTYNGSNALEQVRDAANIVDRREYGSNAQVSSSIFSDGARVNYLYTRGLPTSASHPVSGSTGARYDNIGRVLSLQGPDGATIETSYNDRSQVIERIDAVGGVTRWEFDSRGRQTAIIDPKGNRTQYAYDGNDNVVSVTNARGETTRFSYDGEDRLITETDPLGNVTRYEYDAVGQQVKEIDPLGNELRTEYDAVGNVVAVFGPDGKAVERTTYDVRDLPIRVQGALEGTTRFEYDEIGRLVSTTDPLGRSETLEYDVLDRPSKTVDALGREAERTYGVSDMTSELLDGGGGPGWNFQYDQANRLTDVHAPWNETTDIDYDERDNVSRVSYGSGRSVAFDYDPNNQISRVVRAGAGLIEPDITFEYDANGNIIEVGTKAFSDIEPNPQLVRTYDELDRMTVFRDAHGDELRYAYDAAGRLTELTYPGGDRLRYAYDAANRLTTVTDWANRVTRYGYDDAGNLTRVELPNGTLRTLEFDDAGRITRRRETDAQGLGITDFRYYYDVVGQVTVESSGLQRPPYRPQAVQMTYALGNNRLTSFNGMNVAHDEDGNMTRAPVGGVLNDFQYDNLGNLIQAGSARFTYDAEDRLIEYTGGQGGTTRLTVNPMPDLWQVVAKIDSSGRTRYVWGIGLLYEETSSGIRVYHYDMRGNVVAFSNSQGAVVGQVSYGPFGELGDREGQTDSLFLFGGMFGVITHPNGLNNMRFRWYSPEMKRFLSVDSLFGDIGDISSLNRYIYAGNNAIASADPSGEFAFLVPLAIALFAGGASAGVSAVIDVATTGMLGPPERYVGAFFAGAAVGLCGGCGVLATVGAGVIGGVVGGGAAGLIADAADDGEIQGQRALNATLEGAVTGAATGLAGGIFKGAGNLFSRAAARRAAAATAARQATRAAARGGRLVGRAARAGRTAGRRGGRSGVRGRGGRGARRGADRVHGRRGPRHRRRPVSDSEVSELLSRAPFRGDVGKLAQRTLANNRLQYGNGLQVQFRVPNGASGTNGARFRVVQGGRSALNRGQGSRYGEFRHQNVHRGHRARARVPAPNRPATGGLN